MRSSLALLLALFSGATQAGAACAGVDGKVSEPEKTRIAPALVQQLKSQLPTVSSVDILAAYRSGGWTILYVDTHVADESYVFFHGDPAANRYITLWAGVAQADEEPEIEAWVHQNAPGIPDLLARCFAQVVTRGVRVPEKRTPP